MMANRATTGKRPNEDDSNSNHSQQLTPKRRIKRTDVLLRSDGDGRMPNSMEEQSYEDHRVPEDRQDTQKYFLAPSRQEYSVDLTQNVIPRMFVRACRTFPRPQAADVYIELRSRDAKHSFRLDAFSLRHSSPWFADALDEEVEEPSEMLANDIKSRLKLIARFELQYDPDAATGVLVRVPFTKLKIDVSAMPPDSSHHLISKYEPKRQVSTPESEKTLAISTEHAPNDIDSRPDSEELARDVLEHEQTDTLASACSDHEKIATIVNYETDDTAYRNRDTKATSHEHQMTCIREAYHNLFSIFYSESPCINKDDIQRTLSQVELLLQIAGFYGTEHLVRPIVINSFTEYGRDLYRAIVQDPARWLYLSYFLRCGYMFKEAMIHIVGNYPKWQSRILGKEHLLQNIRELIHVKIHELQTTKILIDKDLFLSGIKIDGKDLVVDNGDMESILAWIIVQNWRDWFVSHLVKANDSNTPNNVHATMYRTMAKGGDAYMPTSSVLDLLRSLRCAELTIDDENGIKEDIQLMKDYAKNRVKPLCINNSMLDIDAEHIEYFTCVKVENDELPWLGEE